MNLFLTWVISLLCCGSCRPLPSVYQMLTWKNGHIQTVHKGSNHTVAFHFRSKNHRKRHAERAGVKYYENKVLGMDKKKHRDQLLWQVYPVVPSMPRKSNLNQSPPSKLLAFHVMDKRGVTKIASLAPWAFAADGSWGFLRTLEAVLWQFEGWRIPWNQPLESFCTSRSAFSDPCVLPPEANKATTPLYSIVSWSVFTQAVLGGQEMPPADTPVSWKELSEM